MTNHPFMAAEDQQDIARMTMGDIFQKNLESDLTNRSGSINSSFLNRTRLTLQNRVSMK